MTGMDARLKALVDDARHRTLAWLDTMQAPGAPKGVTLASAAHDTVAWPGMLLPGTYNAVMCRVLLAGAWEGDALADWLRGFRRPDGIFRIPGMAEADVFKKQDPVETWRYIDFHVTNYTLGAIDALQPGAPVVLDFARPFRDVTTLKAWLCDRDLRDPWQEGNNIVNLGGFLLALPDHEAAMETLFAWHDRLQEPATGFWGVNQTDPLGALHAMAGSMHNYHLYYATRRPLPYQDRAVDYALGQPVDASTACIDVDLIDLLVHAHALIDHRRGEIEAWLRGKLSALLALQQDDGGFYDEPTGVRRQDGWVRGYSEPQGLSNSFATWFRWIGIAMIADLLWPGWHPWQFRRGVGIGYRMPRS
jgi:hypothetical protein